MYSIGFETLIGYNDIKTSDFVSFYVQRKSALKIYDKVVPWEVEKLNIGNAMYLTTGIFTTPVNGRYHFGFNAMASSKYNAAFLRLNSGHIAQSFCDSSTASLGYNLPVYATLNLKKGDTVDMFLKADLLSESEAPRAMFFGFLIEEDLFL